MFVLFARVNVGVSIIKYIFCIFDVNFEDNLKGSPRDLRMDYSRGNVNRVG